MSEIIPQTESSNVFIENTTEQLDPEEVQRRIWYFEWKARVHAAEMAQRDKWAKKPGYNKSLQVPSYDPWDAPELTQEEKDRIYVEIKLDKFYELNDGFSPAAHAVVHSPDSARFLDDFKCGYLGDSNRLGAFREISPSFNDTPFDVQFDYNKGRINHYTENGMVVHVRETSDPAAKTREQKLFIVLANLITGELSRVYAHDHDEERAHLSPGFEHSLDETINLKPRHLTGLNGLGDIQSENIFATKFSNEVDYVRQKRQPRIQFHQNGRLDFKPEGYVGFERLRPIAQLDYERHLLGRLALQGGQSLNERGAIEHSPTRLSIAN